MPELRKRDQAISAELNALESQLADRAGYLRLAWISMQRNPLTRDGLTDSFDSRIWLGALAYMVR
jgi:hypothetical protein